MIRLERITLAAGATELLRDASLQVRAGERIGLVGRNGTGKTTLLRAILGEVPVESGRIHRPSALRIGYLPQQAVAGSSRTVWEEVRTGCTRLVELQRRLDRAQRAADRGEDGAAERLGEALAAFELAGGYSWDERVGTVLHGLGFTPPMWNTRCDRLSGGWQMRTALARMLLSEPELALLDEPTNHLDLHARIWLAARLRDAPWTTIVVSHDRHLLDTVATRIVEVRNRTLTGWKGNFSRFLVAREEALAQQRAAKERQDAEIAHIQRYIDRFGAKATKARQAQSRAKRLEKIERIEVEQHSALPRIRLPEPPASANLMVRLLGLSAGWPGSEPSVHELDLELERGMRVALVGDNGSGKSTLLRTIAGELEPLAGRRLLGDRVQLGIFHQDLAAALPADRTALELLQETTPLLGETRLRSILGALGLSGDRALRPIGALSGGEKARVALAKLAARPHNLLLLDEPTNHLDAETVEVLVRALAQWTGALVFVSHDRYVVETLATHVLRLAPPFSLEEGVRPEHFQRTAPAPCPATSSRSRDDHARRKKRQRELERAERRLEALPAVLEEAEDRLSAKDDELIAASDDWERATALGLERDALQAEVDRLYAEWEELERTIARLRTALVS